MKPLLSTALLWLAGLLPLAATAQVIPPLPAPAPANLQGEALRTWLRQNWYDPYRTVLDYGTARGKMYNYVDNFDNKVTCVYSGYAENVTFSATNTSPAVVTRLNTEHTVPQSWFNETVRMRSDLHHLYPTFIQWNSNRGADPFAEIPDATTKLWMRGEQSQTTIPAANLAEYSEDTDTQFEPREDHKGNLARSAFYFYTVHAGESFDPGKGTITALADLQTLYQWHLADPVDEHERERNRRVAASQGNYNPYVADPALVARAWGFTPAGPLVAFSAATGTIAEGNAGPSTYTTTLSVSPAPTSALSVEVAFDAASSTAASGSDFAFSTPQTVTFAAGQTTATVAVTITGDTQPEADETLTLALQNPGPGASIGGPASHVLTIVNDDGPAPTVRFAAATGSIGEGNSGTSTYTVAVNFTGTLPAGGFTVPVTVEASSTASSPADYVLSTPTLTFGADAATQRLVTVVVSGDLTPEANETVRLRLGPPSNASVVVGAPVLHVLTIRNDDQAPVGGLCQDLYFSEYAESGSGTGLNTKVLEIYNPTRAPIPLAGVRVELFANGATTATAKQELSGTVAPGGVFLLANTGVTDPGVKALGPLESSVGFFNGDDALALFSGTDTLDIIGVIGQKPANGFAVPGATTVDNTLERLPATGRGSTRWAGEGGAAATWQAVGVNVFSGLGRYVSTACVVAIVTATRAGLPTPLPGLKLFPNPATHTLYLRLPDRAGAAAATIELLDNLGRVVRRRAAAFDTGSPAQLDLRGLPAGLYAVRVRTAGEVYTGRVLIE